MTRILITGGAGYVGSALIPSLLEKGYEIIVFDLYIYGFRFNSHPNLKQIVGDIRNKKKLISASKDSDILIHLACISNDPSFDLNPKLGRSINLDAFHNILDAVNKNGVKRLIFASSSSVYGINNGMTVREDTIPVPLTDYSRYKLECEEILLNSEIDTEKIIFRPATLCGFAGRLRLDLVVNLLTINGLINQKIKIFGGNQMRANLHIKDMVRAYEFAIESPSRKIDNQIFNVGHQNMTIEEIANIIKDKPYCNNIELGYQQSNDIRSYHINSDKIKSLLGFIPQYSVEDAIEDLIKAYSNHKISDGLKNPRYHNIKMMKKINLK